MIRHEKKFREQLEHIANELNMLKDLPELCSFELESLSIKAASETQIYVKQQGLNGYLYDTERVRQNLVGGFSSKGKKFRSRLYRLTALEIGVELFSNNIHDLKNLFNLIFGAAYKNQSCISRLAHILNWNRKFYPSATSDSGTRSTPFSTKSKFAGSRYEKKPEPPKPPILYTRRLNEWAYKKAKVSTRLIPLTETWDEILNVEPTALWKEIRTAAKKLAMVHHSDIGSEWADDFVMQRILAAYDVAKKIYNRR